jgi:type I restriction enzyme S subunit
MASEWRSGTLNDVANIKTGKLDSNHATVGGQYPFFTCAPEPLQIGSYAFDDDAIILAGNNANGIFHLNRYTGKFNAYQRTYVLTAKNPTQVDLDYLFYTLTTLTRRLEEFSQGTATKFLTKTILTSLPIALPSLTEQRAIGMLLRCLDNGIRSRLTQNECLESVASAIFKSWFVDFDPVRAKAEEREPEGMDAATAALFPDELEDGPSGRVPKGWKMSPITVLANIVYGAPFASNSFSSSRIGGSPCPH